MLLEKYSPRINVQTLANYALDYAITLRFFEGTGLMNWTQTQPRSTSCDPYQLHKAFMPGTSAAVRQAPDKWRKMMMIHLSLNVTLLIIQQLLPGIV